MVLIILIALFFSSHVNLCMEGKHKTLIRASSLPELKRKTKILARVDSSPNILQGNSISFKQKFTKSDYENTPVRKKLLKIPELTSKELRKRLSKWSSIVYEKVFSEGFKDQIQDIGWYASDHFETPWHQLYLSYKTRLYALISAIVFLPFAYYRMGPESFEFKMHAAITTLAATHYFLCRVRSNGKPSFYTLFWMHYLGRGM
ncbi:MAG: hypothetical protein WDZ41_03690 [Candidatus Babeliales bacterium]